MIQFLKERLQKLFSRFSEQSLLVIGDMMVDHYVWGNVSRISPEAPVPIVNVESESFRLGGAANVASNVMTLGARPIPVGVVGNDHAGQMLKQLFSEKGILVEGIVTDQARKTTLKTRVIAHHQHVVRTDREDRFGISPSIQRKIENFVRAQLPFVNGIILEDYNKGVLVPKLIHSIIEMAKEARKPVFVDPKYEHFFEYQGVWLFKPNRKEAGERLGMHLTTEEALQKALEKLLERLACHAVLITLGEEGMIFQEQGNSPKRVPTRAMNVHDVSGAGDTVIATLAVALSAGADLEEGVTIANHAAGVVCEEVGVVPIDREVLFQRLIAASK